MRDRWECNNKVVVPSTTYCFPCLERRCKGTVVAAALLDLLWCESSHKSVTNSMRCYGSTRKLLFFFPFSPLPSIIPFFPLLCLDLRKV